MISFTIEGEPVPKGRPRFTRHGGVYTPKRTKDAERAIAWRAKKEMKGLSPTEKPVSVKMDFLCKANFNRSDLDNLEKLILDSLNKIVWKDDRQVISIEARKIKSEFPETFISVLVAP